MVPYTTASNSSFSRIAFIGGVLLVLHYMLHLTFGLITQQNLWGAMDTYWGRLDGTVLAIALGAIHVALLSLLLNHLSFLNNLKYFALISSLIGLAAVMTGLFTFWVDQLLMEAFMVSTGSFFISTTLLGFSSYHSNVFPLRVSIALILLGLCSFPIKLMLSNLAGVLPGYVWAEVYFLPVGLAWVYLGLHFNQARKVRLR